MSERPPRNEEGGRGDHVSYARTEKLTLSKAPHRIATPPPKDASNPLGSNTAKGVEPDMMSTRPIYELHLLDAEILQKEAALARVNHKLEDDAELRRAGDSLHRGETELSELQRKQRDADAVISDIQAKLVPLERRAYSGVITNTRELQGVEQEVKSLKRRLGEAEDSSLLLMEETEQAEQLVVKSLDDFSSVEGRRNREVEDLTRERDELQANLVDLTGRRGSQASSIDATTTSLYESLRSSKGGLAVATVERGMCRSCRISLPMNVNQRARAGKELVQCPSCAKILFAT